MPEETWEEGRFGGRDQDLGGAAGSVAVGLRRTVLPPGKQSFPRHAHMAEEEIFFVVRGRGTLLRGEESVAVEAGDVAAFPAGTGVAHAFVAHPGEELEYLSIGERDDNDVVLYPDSGKLLVVGLADESGERRGTGWAACKRRTTSTASSSGPRGRSPPVDIGGRWPRLYRVSAPLLTPMQPTS